MSADDPIDLVRDGTPADFGTEDLATLEAAIARRDVCEEIVARLRFDETLGTALGAPRLDVDAILTDARSGPGGRGIALAAVAVLGASLLVAAGVIVGGREQRARPSADRQPASLATVAPSELVDDAARAADVQDLPAAVAGSIDEPPPAAPPPASTVAVVPPPAPAQGPAAAEPPAVVPESVDPFAWPGPKAVPPTARDLAERFEPVTGGIVDQQHDNRPHGRIDGVMRLTSALGDGAALRFAAVEYGSLRIHLWHGTEGVTFDAYGGVGPWAAYATTRTAEEPLPNAWALVDRDTGRSGRTNPQAGGGVEVRFADGRVTLVRGDVPIVSAALPGPPGEIFFEGQATFREVALTRARPLPQPSGAAERPARPLRAGVDAWLRPPAAVGTFATPDGGATLHVEANPQPAWALLPVRDGGLGQIECLVERPEAGTGICIAGADGVPRHALLFMANTRMPGQLQLERRGVGDNTFETGDDPATRPLPLVDGSGPLWLRLTACGGLTRVEISRDGLHWALAIDPQGGLPAITALGPYAVAHASPRTLRLARMQVRECPVLESLAPSALRSLAVEVSGNQPLANWLLAVDAVQPPQVDRPAWRRGCALGQLAGTCSPELAVDLLLMLWRDSLAMPMAADVRWRLLDEIMELAPVWGNGQATERCLALYEQLGERLADEGLVRCYSEVAPRQMATRLVTSQGTRVFPEALARREALTVALAGDMQALEVLGQRLAYFQLAGRPGNEALFTWLQGVARSGPSESTLPADWRHPLTLDSGKEAAAFRAEVDAALESEAWNDVSQLIAAAVSDDAVQLLPAGDDPGLLVSLPVAVQRIQRTLPRFVETLRDEQAAAALLRLRQAMDAGDVDRVNAVTVQFMGTPAAALAHAWLGDRRLSAGDLPLALRHYAAAAADIPPADAARVADANAVARDLVAVGTRRPLPAATPPRRVHTLVPRARMEGDVGANPGGLLAEIQRGGAAWVPSVDWVARQVSVAPLEDRLLVANRFQLASHDRGSGAVQWRAGLGPDAGPTHEWPGQPMRPAVTATHAFVRRLKNAGPVLAAIRLQDGAVAWESPPLTERWIVSDPIVVGGRLLACTATKVDDGFALAIATFDERSGAMVVERRVVHLGAGWWRQRVCQFAALDDGLVVVAGGGVVHCDFDGTPRWMRRDLWIPPAVEEFWAHQGHGAPLVHRGLLYVAQPGVPCLAALDPESGAAVWRAAEPCLRRIVGSVGDTIVGERSTRDAERPVELVGFDARSGRVTWRYGGDLLDGSLATVDGIMAAIRVSLEGSNAKAPALVWLDPATGQPGPQVVLAAGADPLPFLGPVVRQGDRVWALFGRGHADPTRELVELVPQ